MANVIPSEGDQIHALQRENERLRDESNMLSEMLAESELLDCLKELGATEDDL
ncbi:MAG: hypothetical protein RR482_02290 [Clostridia bacterium]